MSSKEKIIFILSGLLIPITIGIARIFEWVDLYFFGLIGIDFVMQFSAFFVTLNSIMKGYIPNNTLGMEGAIIQLFVIGLSWLVIPFIVKFTNRIPLKRRILYIWIIITHSSIISFIIAGQTSYIF